MLEPAHNLQAVSNNETKSLNGEFAQWHNHFPPVTQVTKQCPKELTQLVWMLSPKFE